jgi:polyisoprenoid-binding protein YceI
MRSFILSAAAFLALSTAALAAEPAKYTFDKSHTRMLFFINHLGFSEMVGEFTAYDGGFTFDEKAPEKSAVDVTLKPAGIRTSSPELDKHLQSKDFFNSEQFPDIRFVSTGVKITGEKTGEVMGNLTMLGVTKPATLNVRFNKADFHPMTQAYVAGFQGEATVKRSDFGMNYGIPMVGDEVRLEVYTEGNTNDVKKPDAVKKH